jgi:hypothetical protein
MTSRTENARKRKQTAEGLEVVVSSDNDRSKSKSKARRVSTDALASTIAFRQTTEKASVAPAAAPAIAPPASMEIIGMLIQDLALSDKAKVNDALAALKVDLVKDKKKCESFVTAGGCLALVQLLKKCLDKAMKKIPQCDQVAKLNKSAELTTLHKTLIVIDSLTFHHDESEVVIAAIGGAEAVVKAMKTFPKCQALQEGGCVALRNLTCRNGTGKKKAIESGGIEVLLTAVNNHLGSPDVCENACWALSNIVEESKENTELLITLGGGAAVAKVRRKWLDNDEVQTEVRDLNNLIVAEMKAWGGLGR